MSEPFSRGMLDLDAEGECDTCGREERVAVVASGVYCWRHIPAGDLDRLLDDLGAD